MVSSLLITFGQVLDIGIARLKQAGINGYERDAKLLLQSLMHEDNNFIFLHRNDGIEELQADVYFDMIDRRADREPLQYITGSQEFMGHNFQVNESVLIPRQDTETVVEFAIDKAHEMKKCTSVLDMCCGSGAIAVSMVKALPKADAVACDCSDEALKTAKINAVQNGVDNRINFKKTDMFEEERHGKISQIKGKFDMIICNPPYIPSNVIETLQTEVKDHEPRMALDGGDDGLDFYRIIAKDASAHLKKKGVMVLEIGHDQAAAVSDLLQETSAYADIEVHQDLVGHDRIVCCTLA
jgi:release factor glutamine methyltransferase